MREAVPQLAIALCGRRCCLGALRSTAPPLALAVLIAVPPAARRLPLVLPARAGRVPLGGRRLRRGQRVARRDRRRRRSTVEAHRLGASARRAVRAADPAWMAWERYTLWLRPCCSRSIKVAHVLPCSASSISAAASSSRGAVSIVGS